MATEVLKDQTSEQVADAFRRWGYLEADLDPLGRLVPERHAELSRTGPEAKRFRRF
jgi:2-oxoglutarate dehydrogenase E1 component